MRDYSKINCHFLEENTALCILIKTDDERVNNEREMGSELKNNEKIRGHQCSFLQWIDLWFLPCLYILKCKV